MKKIKAKLEALSKVLGECKTCLIISHNNPDPDAMASAILLKRVFSAKFNIKSELVYGGVIGRAENKALIDYAREEFKKFTKAAFKRADFVALVDAQPDTGNTLIESFDKVLVVFDHHKIRPKTRGIPFYEVRSNVGATVTLVYQYAKEAGVEFDGRLATIMAYALQSETSELQKERSLADVKVFMDVADLVDDRAIWLIKNTKVGIGYFASIYRAIEKATMYGDIVTIILGELPYPDVTAEVAEYFLKYKDASCSLVIGTYEEEILFSARTDEKNAGLGNVVRSVVSNLGTAGGHGSAAGGQISLREVDGLEESEIEGIIIKRFLKELKADKRKGVRFLEGVKKLDL